MTADKGPDAEAPAVSFGSYVMPGTVRKQREKRPEPDPEFVAPQYQEPEAVAKIPVSVPGPEVTGASTAIAAAVRKRAISVGAMRPERAAHSPAAASAPTVPTRRPEIVRKAPSPKIEAPVREPQPATPPDVSDLLREPDPEIKPVFKMLPPAQAPFMVDSFPTAQELQRPAPARKRPPAMWFAIDPIYSAVGAISLATFVTGVVLTLVFARSDEDTQAFAEAPAPVDMVSQTAPNEAHVAEVAVTQAAVAQAPVAPEPSSVPSAISLQRAVAASLEPGVARQDTSDLITPSGGMSRVGSETLSMEEILRGLSHNREVLPTNDVAQAILNRNKLQMLREGVLSGDYIVKTVKRHGQDRLCLRLPNGSVSPDEAADLLRDAAARGEIILPEAVNTADGDFDADTLIFNLVQTSLANDGTAEGTEAAREMSRRAFAASEAKTSRVAGQRMYLVEPGDSLAYISLQFFGRPSDYLKIFEANRSLLSSPDEIQIGQRLIIPG